MRTCLINNIKNIFYDAYCVIKVLNIKIEYNYYFDFNNILFIIYCYGCKKALFLMFEKQINKKIKFFLTRGEVGYIIFVACAVKCEVADTPIKVVITDPSVSGNSR